MCGYIKVINYVYNELKWFIFWIFLFVEFVVYFSLKKIYCEDIGDLLCMVCKYS